MRVIHTVLLRLLFFFQNFTMYSVKVPFIIAAMVITGAMRSVAVKIFFQMGFEKPYFVTMLFHIAGLPAFVVHYLYRCSTIRKRRRQSVMDVSVLPLQRSSQRGDQTVGEKSINITTEGAQNNSSEQSTAAMTPCDIEIQDIEIVPNDPPIHTEEPIESDTGSHCMGSQTGLTEDFLTPMPTFGLVESPGIGNSSL